jgi:hypothetical protein
MERKIEPRKPQEVKKPTEKQDKKLSVQNKNDTQPTTPTGYHGTDDERSLNPEE